jgi:malate dehydrogenase (oxaloacetate-decarboxylating)
MKIPEILLVESEHRAGSLAKILAVIGDAGLVVEHLATVGRSQNRTVWEITLEMDEEADRGVFDRIDELPNARVIGMSDRVFNRHRGGKIQTVARQDIGSHQILRDLYTPGVARVCLAIAQRPELVYEYTNLSNTVAIVTNGSAVLGLGDIGAVAGLPVMEGKAALFAKLADISGIPILIESGEPAVIVETVAAIAPSFGAIQLEDIGAPACFEIEAALVERLDRPVLHDDQHGTAVVALAALLSATNGVGRELADASVGQIGLGAAGIGIARLLLAGGVRKLLGADVNPSAVSRFESMGGIATDLDGVMARCDVVVATTGVRGLIRPEKVRPGQVILALSNPEPEIEPQVALRHGAASASDGKSINNVLGFPGLFRGALDARAPRFDDDMLLAAARTLSDLAPEGDLVPDPLDLDVHIAVAEAVRRVAAGNLRAA